MRVYLLIFLLFSTQFGFSKTIEVDSGYFKAFDILKQMLANNDSTSFKRAVFITENAYLQNKLDYSKFNEHIERLATLAGYWMQANPLINYHRSDSLNVLKNYALYSFLKDTLKLATIEDGEFMHLPYTYDFDDFTGQKEWSNMFVTKLLVSHSGNCHSLPYLYKILADELDASCWLSLAPNHMYISNRCKKNGWYNTELTSGDFPTDAWIMASGYLPLKAVQSGIYMDTLSNKQSIALCVLDLAKGYEHKTKNYYDGFILKCCELSLQYFPLNIQAMLLKAETLKHIYEKQTKENIQISKTTYHEMEILYAHIFELGYREMPDKMYMQWLESVVKERSKYSNSKLIKTLKE